MKDVGCTVGSEAKCTTNELIVVVSVHGSDKKGGDCITVAHDSGGGIPDTLTTETDEAEGEKIPEASVINGDIYSGGEDPDNCSTNHPADEPKKE